MKNLNSLVKNISLKNIILFVFLILLCYICFFKNNKESFASKIIENDYSDPAKTDDDVINKDDIEYFPHVIDVYQTLDELKNNKPYDFGTILDYTNYGEWYKTDTFTFILHKIKNTTYLTKLDSRNTVTNQGKKNPKSREVFKVGDRDNGKPLIIINMNNQTNTIKMNNQTNTIKMPHHFVKISYNFVGTSAVVASTDKGEVYFSFLRNNNPKEWTKLTDIPGNPNKVNNISLNCIHNKVIRKWDKMLITISVNEKPICFIAEVKIHRYLDDKITWNKCVNVLNNNPKPFKQILIKSDWIKHKFGLALDNEGKLYFTPQIINNSNKNSIEYLHNAFWRDLNGLISKLDKNVIKEKKIPLLEHISRLNYHPSVSGGSAMNITYKDNKFNLKLRFNIDAITKQGVAINIEFNLNYQASKIDGRISSDNKSLTIKIDKYNSESLPITLFKNINHNNWSRNFHNNFFAVRKIDGVDKLCLIKSANIVSCSEKVGSLCNTNNSRHGVNESIEVEPCGTLDLRHKKCKFSEASEGINNFMDVEIFKGCQGKNEKELCSLRHKLSFIIGNDGIDDESIQELKAHEDGKTLYFDDSNDSKKNDKHPELYGTVSQILENVWNKFIKTGQLPQNSCLQTASKTCVPTVAPSDSFTPFIEERLGKTGLVLDLDKNGNPLPCQNETIIRWAATKYLSHITDNINFAMTSEDSDALSTQLKNSVAKIMNTLVSHKKTNDELRSKLDSIYEETANQKPLSKEDLEALFEKEQREQRIIEEEANNRYNRQQQKILAGIEKNNKKILSKSDTSSVVFNAAGPGFGAAMPKIVNASQQGKLSKLPKNAKDYMKKLHNSDSYQ